MVQRRMVSSGMLRRVALVRTAVSEESSASFIRVIRIGELGTTQAATSNRNDVFPILLTYHQAVKDYSALDVRLKEFFASVLGGNRGIIPVETECRVLNSSVVCTLSLH
jgi:hypothetical protein